MRTPLANRISALRRLAGCGAIGLCVMAAATSPALAGGTQRGAGKTITLRFYSVVTSFTYTRADGTVVQRPPQTPSVGDQMEIVELAYAGTHQKHAKKWSITSHTLCVFKSAKGAPTCDGQSAVGGNQMLFFHTPADSAPIVSGGTGRYAGATGKAAMTEIANTNNSDVTVVVHLRK